MTGNRTTLTNAVLLDLVTVSDTLPKLTDYVQQLQLQQHTLQQELTELKEQLQLLKIENNEQQRTIEELQTKLKDLQTVTIKNAYQGQANNAAMIQAVFRGYAVRKGKILQLLAETRQREVKEASSQLVAKLTKEGKFAEVVTIAQTTKK